MSIEINKWFQQWVENNIIPTAYPAEEDDTESEKLGAQCEQDAKEAGFSREQIEAAIEDTLESAIYSAMVSAADAEVDRMVAGDRT